MVKPNFNNKNHGEISHISVALARYLRWLVNAIIRATAWRLIHFTRLGVKTRVFHLGDYRRAHLGLGQEVPDDYFFVNGEYGLIDIWRRSAKKWPPLASASTVLLRQKILKKCRDDIYHFLNHENGQVAIYDAVNALAAGRRALAKEFANYDVQV